MSNKLVRKNKAEKYFGLIATLILFFNACEFTQQKSLSLQKELTNIQSSASFDSWIRKPQLRKIGNEQLLFNLYRGYLEVYNLADRSHLRRIDFQPIKHLIGSPFDFYVHNWDSIFLISDHYLTLVDTSMNVHVSVSLYEQPSDSLYYMHPKGSIGANRIFFDEQKKILFGMIIPRGVVRETKEYYDKPIEGMFDMTSMKLNPVPYVQYPEIYKGEAHFGVMSCPNRTITENGNMLYTFPVSDKIFELSLKTGEYSQVGESGLMKYTALPRESIDFGLIQGQLLETNVFLEVIEDKYRGLFYQFQLDQAQNESQDPGMKGINLHIFSEDFKHLEVISLNPKIYFPVGSFVTEEGLWVSLESPYREDNKEDIIEYEVFSFGFD